jgi:hypothetical protein
MVDLVEVADTTLISAVIDKHTSPVLADDPSAALPVQDPGRHGSSKLSPKAAEAMWSLEALNTPDLFCLPSTRHLNHALAQLLVTFRHRTQKKATCATDGTPSTFEPILALYCPLEGGEVCTHHIIY